MLLSEAKDRCGAARVAIRGRGGLAAAWAEIEPVMEKLACIEGRTGELAELYASIASTLRDLGDGRAEEMIVRAIALEASVVPERPVVLGTHQLFYARWLLDQRRWAEAERCALQGVETYARGAAKGPELARVRQDVARMVMTATAARAHARE